ncbi:MAG: WbqC family protein [Bernardetiaceae bacterium]|nr:WbqC family protein [Bernardetiaceae bacterium]
MQNHIPSLSKRLKTAKAVVLDLHYFPPLDFFAVCEQIPHIYIERQAHYIKQSYTNRCRIRGVNKILDLSVPVERGSQRKCLPEVAIAYQEAWVAQHLHSIRSAYGNTPFFIYYYDYFERILQQKPKHLFELNLEILTNCLKFVNLDIKINFTEKFYTDYESTDMIDLRTQIHPKKTAIFKYPAYTQIFGNEFAQNLSILDLLFNQGTQAKQYLQDVAKSNAHA